MPFPHTVREKALVNSHRRCCVCHEFGGRSVNVHHIVQEADGGPNTIENAICLCLRCHAEAGHYNPHHPMGTKYSPGELRMHRDQWWSHCQSHPDEPLGLFLDVNFKVRSRSTDVHKYRLVAKYTNALKETHDGWKVKIFIPSFVPVEVGDFDKYDVNVDGSLYTMLEERSAERVFPGETIEVVPNMNYFFIEYEVNNDNYSRILRGGNIMWKFFTSSAPVIEGERPIAELQEF
jgi:hypothetical protein